jgi:DNA gyrase subunit A
MSESGLIKRIPTTAFKAQKRASKGVKTQNDITSAIIRTNTVDSLMVFSNQGNMYRLIVDAIPAGTNASTGVPIKSLIEMKDDEEPTIIYSIYKDTDAKYVMFVTKNGMVKKTLLEEYINTKRKTGIQAIKLKEGDSLASVFLVKEENVYIATRNGFVIKFDSKNISATSRVTCGVKGITLKEDIVVAAGAIRDTKDELALFTESGLGKRTPLTEFTIQNRGGKGLVGYKLPDDSDGIAAAALINDEDMILILGNISSVCLSAKDVPSLGRATSGNIMIKNNKVLSVSKV